MFLNRTRYLQDPPTFHQRLYTLSRWLNSKGADGIGIIFPFIPRSIYDPYYLLAFKDYYLDEKEIPFLQEASKVTNVTIFSSVTSHARMLMEQVTRRVRGFLQFLVNF